MDLHVKIKGQFYELGTGYKVTFTDGTVVIGSFEVKYGGVHLENHFLDFEVNEISDSVIANIEEVSAE